MTCHYLCYWKITGVYGAVLYLLVIAQAISGVLNNRIGVLDTLLHSISMCCEDRELPQLYCRHKESVLQLLGGGSIHTEVTHMKNEMARMGQNPVQFYSHKSSCFQRQHNAVDPFRISRCIPRVSALRNAISIQVGMPTHALTCTHTGTRTC